MTLTINYDKKEIIIGDDCNVADLIRQLNEICEDPFEWTICKTVVTKEVIKEIVNFKELPLSQPYKPWGEQPTIKYQTNTDSNTNIS